MKSELKTQIRDSPGQVRTAGRVSVSVLVHGLKLPVLRHRSRTVTWERRWPLRQGYWAQAECWVVQGEHFWGGCWAVLSSENWSGSWHALKGEGVLSCSAAWNWPLSVFPHECPGKPLPPLPDSFSFKGVKGAWLLLRARVHVGRRGCFPPMPCFEPRLHRLFSPTASTCTGRGS